jgi:putative tryptophan/tyrosine transport system substrate-binding protein
MRRREFVALLGGTAVGWPATARAQPANAMPTVGVLWHAGSADEEQPYFGALNRGFKDLGYVEGQTIKHRHVVRHLDLVGSVLTSLIKL